MALRESGPASVTRRPVPADGPRLGRWHRLYALAVVLLLTSALVYQLWRDPGADPAPQSGGDDAAAGAPAAGGTVHQRTVAGFVGTDRIRVVEHLTYAAPTDAVTLVSPDRTGALAPFAPTVVGLWVDDGSGRRAAEVPAPGGSVRVRLAEPVTEVTVGYDASGVVERTPDSAAGRALALVTPLRAGDAPGLRAVEVRGDWVETLGCLDEAGELFACGRGTSSGWSTTAEDARLTDVFAQLTLPAG